MFLQKSFFDKSSDKTGVHRAVLLKAVLGKTELVNSSLVNSSLAKVSLLKVALIASVISLSFSSQADQATDNQSQQSAKGLASEVVAKPEALESDASNLEIISSNVKEALSIEAIQKALAEVSTTHPIAGELQVSFKDVEEFEGEPRESVGTVGFFINENPNGLTISYDKEVTNAIKQEAALRVEDEEAKTPTIDAIREVSTNTINRILSPISSVNSLLTHATLQEIEDIEQDGRRLKKMTFTMPVESFIRNKQVRKYVDKFDGKLTITATEEGVPVEMATVFEGSGRAYIFFSMKAAGSSLNRYEVVNDRLVMTFSERYNKYESTFGNGENSSILMFSPKEMSQEQPQKAAYLANTSNDTSM